MPGGNRGEFEGIGGVGGGAEGEEADEEGEGYCSHGRYRLVKRRMREE
jgi:hypothetical protein